MKHAVVTLPNGYQTMSTFIDDFRIAEMFGFDAVKDTWKRAFDEWKDDIDYMIELSIAVYYLGMQHYENDSDMKLAQWYFDRYYDVEHWVYGEGNPFNADERRRFFDVID